MNVRRVGVREFKSKLSAFLRLVQEGESIVVTDRGRDIAELHKPGLVAPGVSPYARLVASGWIRPPIEPEDFSWLDEPGPGLPAGTAQELIDFERGEDE